ncbi:AAA-like domain-containing protein [Sorangium sp. So ce1504]|uniref:AAA-like domain-containing protein n=1 Tax=Sorangium sp. So ce1504 TaxID=3133337 RepID=UPI003F61BBE7
MTLQHDALPRSVGRIRATLNRGGSVYGTGFLVTPTRVLTCAHCLRGPAEEKAAQGSISFTQARDASEVPFKVVFERFDPDVGLDIAVLELARQVEGTACLPLSGEDLAEHPDWRSFGHPLSIERAPLWLGGTVDGSIARRAAGTDGWLLSLHVNGDPAPIEGMSGAPVLTERGVVGLVSHQLYKRVAPDGGGKPSVSPAFAKAFAVPTRLLQSIPSFLRSIAGSSRVFLAYRRKEPEATFVAELQRALQGAGHEAFVDLDIKVGEDWARRIQTTLERADVFVPVLTPDSLESQMLLQEVRIAYARWRQTGRPILLPVRDPALEALPFEFDTYLGRLQYAPWRGEQDTPSAVRAVMAAIGHQAVEPGAPQAPAAPPSLPKADFQRIRMSAGALPPGDLFYLERPVDADAYDRMGSETFVLTMLSPSGFGKTSLALRLRQRCEDEGRPVLLINFRSFGRLPKDDGENRGYVTFLNDLARVFCKGLKLPLPTQPLESPTDFEEVLMMALEEMPRLVLILDGVDRVIERPYAEEFFSSIRSWIDAVHLSCSFVLCIATEPSDLMTDITRSPFNIDKGPIELGTFAPGDIAIVAERASFRLGAAQVDLLHQATGGHPALTRQALAYVLAPGKGKPSAPPTSAEIRDRVAFLHEQCGSLTGPFSMSLKALLSRIESIPPQLPDQPKLVSVMRKIVHNRTLSPVEARAAAALVTLGLVRAEGRPAPRFVALNLAYAQFFGALT